jgi:hypothetical protein
MLQFRFKKAGCKREQLHNYQAKSIPAIQQVKKKRDRSDHLTAALRTKQFSAGKDV